MDKGIIITLVINVLSLTLLLGLALSGNYYLLDHLLYYVIVVQGISFLLQTYLSLREARK